MRITLLFLLPILFTGCTSKGFDPVGFAKIMFPPPSYPMGDAEWEEYRKTSKEMRVNTELMRLTGRLHDVKLKSSKDDSYDKLIIQLQAMERMKKAN